MDRPNTQNFPIPAVVRPRTILGFGLLLGIVLGMGLGYWVISDRHNRLSAAQRQSQALASGVERVVTLELRNTERAMHGLSSDAEQLLSSVPMQAPALIAEASNGVMSRQREIQNLVLVDADGTALTGGVGDPNFSRWIASAAHGTDSTLRFGPTHAMPNGRWVLPLALPMPAAGARSQRWILAWFYIDELQSMVDGLDAGRDGVVSLVGPNEVLLARSRTQIGASPLIGRPVAGLPAWQPQHQLESSQRISGIDGLHRVVAMRAFSHYPLQAWAGLSIDQVLRPWYWLVVLVALAYLLYWAWLLIMMRAGYRADRAQRSMLEQLQRNAEYLRLAQHTGKVGTWAMEQGSGHLVWSGNISQIFGLDDAPSASLRLFGRYVHRRDRRMLLRQFTGAWRRRDAFFSEFRMVADDGTERWVAGRGGVVEDKAGHLRMTGTLVDISERMQANSRVTDAERQFRLIFDRNPLPFWVHDARTQRFLEVNRAASLQYGFSRIEFLSMQVGDLCPDGVPDHSGVVQGAGAGFDNAHVSLHRRKDGSTLQARVYGSEIRFGGNDARLILSEDISDRLQYEKELAYRASHDQTTGLINVQTLTDCLNQGQYPGYQVVYLQLRGLQPIRDSLGRETADEVLRTIAARLQQWAGDFGLAAHQPDEDFVLAVLNPKRSQAALDAAIEAVREPISQGDGSLQRLDARFGVAEDNGSGQGGERIIDNAALAAHALESAAFEISRFDGALARRYSDRLHMVSRLRVAIERNEFELHFQPIVRLSDGSVAALEALVRWPQRGGGDISPGDFIPLCEDTGLILPLGNWILRQAAQAQAWLQQQGYQALSVAVNVSAIQLLQADLPSELEAACAQAGIAVDALHLELTESVVMNRAEQGMAVMQRLHEAGVCISLDDFGTGFSSMSYLRHLPLSSIKLDRTFVREVDLDQRNASICRALLQLGHSLDLVMIAEGVERPEELEWLRLHGCDQVQGFLLGRPQPLEAALRHVQKLPAH